ncbi:MAG: sensor domain-containing protein [Segniliparus sp.]|uniref:sensor domain-containing protein n=1 Tax=Segniliparus sp. TaxID=2804064 RepID=UPI003F341201
MAFGFCAAAAVFAGMGVGSLFDGAVVPGHAAPDARLLPLAPTDTTRLVPGSALQSIVVAPEQAARLLGADFGWSRSITAPGADSKTTAKECLLADPVGLRGVYGQDWTAFRKTTVQSAEDDDSAQLVLAVGVYPSEAKAHGLFSSLVSALGDCDGKSATETTAQGADLVLSFEVGPSGADSAQWRSRQESPRERSCSYDARVRRNVLFEVMACVAGSEGKSAKDVADALEETLPS